MAIWISRLSTRRVIRWRRERRRPHGEEEQGNRGGERLVARHCFRNWWNRANGTGALRFQFDMCIVIEDAKAPSHCPPGLVTSHDIINCLGVCVYIYICSSMSLSRICGVVLLRAGSFVPAIFVFTVAIGERREISFLCASRFVLFSLQSRIFN